MSNKNIVDFNPFEHGYKPEDNVEIPAGLFMGLMEALQVGIRQETKEYVEIVSFLVGNKPKQDGKEVVRLMTTPFGQRQQFLFDELLSIHINNVRENKTVSIHDEEKTKLDIADETSDKK